MYGRSVTRLEMINVKKVTQAYEILELEGRFEELFQYFDLNTIKVPQRSDLDVWANHLVKGLKQD